MKRFRKNYKGVVFSFISWVNQQRMLSVDIHTCLLHYIFNTLQLNYLIFRTLKKISVGLAEISAAILTASVIFSDAVIAISGYAAIACIVKWERLLLVIDSYLKNFILCWWLLLKQKTPTSLLRSLWCGPGSNRRHKDFQSFALPTELPHLRWRFKIYETRYKVMLVAWSLILEAYYPLSGQQK